MRKLRYPVLKWNIYTPKQLEFYAKLDKLVKEVKDKNKQVEV